ncbi:MAG: DUF2283 domain-containing protein [Candidatus Aenigmarchaeota archaeon]|nr:DUF2283 domain-containing protein [Candidatus Aenigmarchaeota archaeon]
MVEEINKVRHLEGKGEFDYDYLNDILFFKVKDRNYDRSIETDRFVIDIDEENFVVGIQIFDASEFFKLSKHILRNVQKWQLQAGIRENVIEIRVIFATVFRSKITEQKPIIIERLKEPLPNSQVVCSVR